MLHLEITVEGVVAQADAESVAVRDASVLSCIAARAAQWRFPRSEHRTEMSVTYPFWLRTADSSALTADPRRRAEVRGCYERALVRGAAPTEGLTLSLAVPDAAEGGAMEVESSAPAPAVAACVRAVALRWRLAPSIGPRQRRLVFFSALPP